MPINFKTGCDFRNSKLSLSKSKEKVSADGAEEKLLKKEDEAKIVTRVDMADAAYVVGDHRNGDAKIELDANKKFMGLTKEELMKFSEDPFWINLRWSLFVLFWATWLCMLAAAVVIIVRAPKCYPPPPKHWFERGPLVEVKSAQFDELKSDLETMEKFEIEGIFMDVPTYEVLDEPDILEKFKTIFAKARDHGVRVIVDLIPNSVSVTHKWFVQSVNRTEPYTDYFVWNASKNYDKNGVRMQPNNWVSTSNSSAWVLNKERDEFYLNQFESGQADLNFRSERVQAEFDEVIYAWMNAGASGVRLNRARHLLVDPDFGSEDPDTGRGRPLDADHTHYAFWQHTHTTDQPGLSKLLGRFADKLANSLSEFVSDPSEAVFTLAEESGLQELYQTAHNVSMLRPKPAAPVQLAGDAVAAANAINWRLGPWPSLQLKAAADNHEIAAFALLLPAVPIFDLQQLRLEAKEPLLNESLSHMMTLRGDRAVTQGKHIVLAVPAVNSTENKLLACARWKIARSAYVAVYNMGPVELQANLTGISSIPEKVAIYHISRFVREQTDYCINEPVYADKLRVPANSTVVVSYVPTKVAVEK